RHEFRGESSDVRGLPSIQADGTTKTVSDYFIAYSIELAAILNRHRTSLPHQIAWLDERQFLAIGIETAVMSHERDIFNTCNARIEQVSTMKNPELLLEIELVELAQQSLSCMKHYGLLIIRLSATKNVR